MAQLKPVSTDWQGTEHLKRPKNNLVSLQLPKPNKNTRPNLDGGRVMQSYSLYLLGVLATSACAAGVVSAVICILYCNPSKCQAPALGDSNEERCAFLRDFWPPKRIRGVGAGNFLPGTRQIALKVKRILHCCLGDQQVAGRGHLDCLTNCLSLRSVRRSGGQQGTLSAAKKSASFGVGIISTCAFGLADRARRGEESP